MLTYQFKDYTLKKRKRRKKRKKKKNPKTKQKTNKKQTNKKTQNKAKQNQKTTTTTTKTSSKWIDSSSEGHLQDFSSILKGSSSKIVNWIRGQRSNKSLIFVRNIEVGFLFLFIIFMMSIKLLFDLWPLIQFTIFEEEPCQIEEEPCTCPSEEESIHFEEVFF